MSATTAVPTAHTPCAGASSRSQQSSSSARFQQLLQAKIAAEKQGSWSQSAPPPPQPAQQASPFSQSFHQLVYSDSVLSPLSNGPGQQYPQATVSSSSVPKSEHPQPQHQPEDEISAAFRSVTSERIASMFADTQGQASRQDWQMQDSNAMYPPEVRVKQEPIEPFQHSTSGNVGNNGWATPLQQRPQNLQSDYALWRDRIAASPQSVTSTPSMMSSSSISSLGRPITPMVAHVPMSPQAIKRQSIYGDEHARRVSIKQCPDSPPSALRPYGMSAFTNMNGQIQVPGIMQAASNDGDSLNLNNLGGDGGSNGGYDQGGYGGDGHGGYGGDDHYGDHGNGGYGPPGGNGAGGSGGDGNDPGEGPPPPPKGKKLQLACHFCRRRKLKCDGVRPECANCHKRGETCIFDDTVRRRGPGKRTKDMRQRSGHSMGNNDGAFSSFALSDQPHIPLPGSVHDPSHPSTPDLEQMAAAASASHQHHGHVTHYDNVPSANLPEIDPNIDPALAILGMGMDPDPHSHTHSHTPIPPATLAEADPTRGQKRKSDLMGDDDGKRLKLEDETYEGTLPHDDLGPGVDVDVGVGVGVDIPGFTNWAQEGLTGEGREGEVDEADLAKFENDLRRVIQDQADAEAQASAQ